MNWNPFKKQDTQMDKLISDINDQINQMTQIGAGNNNIGAIGQSSSGTSVNIGGGANTTTTTNIGVGSSGQTLGIGGNGTLVWGGAGGGGGGSGGAGQLTTSQIMTTIQGFMGLTPEEAKELENLNKEQTIENKTLKLSEFKNMPPELRQFVINASFWTDMVKKINETKAPQSDRQKELIQKESISKMFSGSLSVQAVGYMNVFATLPLPEGLTVDDLRQAHLEQTLEEEMLNGKEEE